MVCCSHGSGTGCSAGIIHALDHNAFVPAAAQQWAAGPLAALIGMCKSHVTWRLGDPCTGRACKDLCAVPLQGPCTWKGVEKEWRGVSLWGPQASEEQQFMRQVPSGEWVRDQHVVRATSREAPWALEERGGGPRPRAPARAQRAAHRPRLPRARRCGTARACAASLLECHLASLSADRRSFPTRQAREVSCIGTQVHDPDAQGSCTVIVIGLHEGRWGQPALFQQRRPPLRRQTHNLGLGAVLCGW